MNGSNESIEDDKSGVSRALQLRGEILLVQTLRLFPNPRLDIFSITVATGAVGLGEKTAGMAVRVGTGRRFVLQRHFPFIQETNVQSC